MRIVQDYLPVGPARPGIALDNVLGIVLHWPDVPGQRAREVRSYWASAANMAGASAHCAIDQDGTILQCLPWCEKAQAVGSSRPDPASGRIYTDLARGLFRSYAEQPMRMSPNRVTVSLELCHLDDEGRMDPRTLAAGVELCAWLCEQFHQDPATRIITHSQIVGWKDCPRWFTRHPEELGEFRLAVATRMRKED